MIDLGTAGAAVHDEEGWLVVLGLDLLLDELLVVAQQVGGQHHVAGLVHTVHVTKGGRNGEHRSNGAEGFVHVVNLEHVQLIRRQYLYPKLHLEVWIMERLSE